MNSRTRAFICALFLTSGITAATADDGVVVSIKPVQSLVAGVMAGVGEPTLLLEGAASPHTASLKPSQAQALQDAGTIFWVGRDIETFLLRPLENLGGDAKLVTLSESPGLTRLNFREGATFEGHDHDHGHKEAGHDDHDHDEHANKEAGHDDHDHDEHANKEAGHDDHDHDEHANKEAGHDDHDHDEHAHKEAGHDDHDHDEHARKEAGHDDHDHGDHGNKEAAHDDHDHEGHGHKEAAHDDHDHEGHGHKEASHDDHDHEGHGHKEAGHDGHDHASETDMHLWLDPENAKIFVDAIASALSDADPENADQYGANAKTVKARLAALSDEIRTTVQPVQSKGFIVFHDAYQYFENRFGVSAAGSITVSPEVLPGADRISEIRGKVSEIGATCVFSEPQFEPRIVSVVTEGTDAGTGVLDPLGAGIPAGPDHYFETIRALASSLTSCLATH
ncbi:MAG: zinc ABC transporter substrate-binding protein [Pseudomonadota bacterium]